MTSDASLAPHAPLATAVATGAMAHERTLPVIDGLAAWLPDAGLVRGKVVACTGDAALSMALTLAAAATQAGSWLAVVGVPTVGADAARELGVELGRLVLVDADRRRPQEWAERVAAAADGFELVLTRPPAHAERVLRAVRQRVQARGAVLLTVAGGDGAGADLVIRSTTLGWDGLGAGHGHLRRRRLAVVVAGRRAARPVERECWLPGPSGAFVPVVPVVPVAPAARPDRPDRDALERAG